MALVGRSGSGGNPYFVYLNAERHNLKASVGRTLTAEERKDVERRAKEEYLQLGPDQKEVATSQPYG